MLGSGEHGVRRQLQVNGQLGEGLAIDDHAARGSWAEPVAKPVPGSRGPDAPTSALQSMPSRARQVAGILTLRSLSRELGAAGSSQRMANMPDRRHGALCHLRLGWVLFPAI